MKLPHWTILCIALGSFLLPLLGGHLSIESGSIAATDSVLKEVLAGENAPFLTHFLLSLLFFVPLTVTLFTRKISHVVNLRITFWLALFAACIGVSITVSKFPAVTVLNILDWAMMSLAFFAITLCCGRKQSIIPIVGFMLGSTLAALLGIFEYGQMRIVDPGYRIYALQVGPNQAGALFATGTILCLVMSLRFDRLARLVFILAGVMQGFALALTQSKGAIICLPIGMFVALIGLLALKPAKPGAALATLLCPLILIGLLATSAQRTASVQSGGGLASRITNSGGEAAQSAGFRKLLWSTAIDLTKEKPYGWGLGTFWYESTRPGKVTQTTLAHQTFLQLACEASPIAALSLVAFLGAVVVWGFRGLKTLSAETQILLVGILGGLAVAVAHNFIDSDMYIYGLGSMIFLFCGAFTATSSDSQAPEFIFALPKIAFAATAALLIPLCVSVGLAELYRSEARGALANNDRQGMIIAADAALSATFADGQAYALKALAQPNEADLLAATHFHPSPKAYRALADYYLFNGKQQECYRALDHALETDPNNAAALKKFMEAAEKFGDQDLARSKAEALVATENSTYFTVRSQPELIPTQTYVARLFLAKISKDDSVKAQYLADAVKGFIQYRDITGPVILRNLAAMQTGNFAGEDRKTLETNYTLARNACLELVPLQRRLGLSLGFDPVREADKFAEALATLSK